MNHYMMVPDMAVSQSLTAIMEEMVTKGIISTQALVKEALEVIAQHHAWAARKRTGKRYRNADTH